MRACDGPLYNQYDEGGYLIWFVPEKPVFVDNRQDPYPLAHLRAQLDVQWGSAPYRPLFERWGIRCAFLPAASSTAAALTGDGWVTRYRDDRYVVLATPGGRPLSLTLSPLRGARGPDSESSPRFGRGDVGATSCP